MPTHRGLRPVEGHSLRYIDWPRHGVTDPEKRHRFVCECGELGQWVKNVPAASRQFDKHLMMVRGEWHAKVPPERRSRRRRPRPGNAGHSGVLGPRSDGGDGSGDSAPRARANT